MVQNCMPNPENGKRMIISFANNMAINLIYQILFRHGEFLANLKLVIIRY